MENLETKTRQLSAENSELKKSLQVLKSKVEKMKLESNSLADSPFGSRTNSSEWVLPKTAKDNNDEKPPDLFGFGSLLRSFSMGGSWGNGQV